MCELAEALLVEYVRFSLRVLDFWGLFPDFELDSDPSDE